MGLRVPKRSLQRRSNSAQRLPTTRLGYIGGKAGLNRRPVRCEVRPSPRAVSKLAFATAPNVERWPTQNCTAPKKKTPAAEGGGGAKNTRSATSVSLFRRCWDRGSAGVGRDCRPRGCTVPFPAMFRVALFGGAAGPLSSPLTAGVSNDSSKTDSPPTYKASTASPEKP